MDQNSGAARKRAPIARQLKELSLVGLCNRHGFWFRTRPPSTPASKREIPNLRGVVPFALARLKHKSLVMLLLNAIEKGQSPDALCPTR